jgi:hypothetical protein
MQQVLNAKDRNQAFFQFLVLFLISVSLVVGAVYFNYKMPAKVNNILQDQINMQQSREQYQQKFIGRMLEAKLYLDSLSKDGVNVSLLDMQLTEHITDLLNLQQKDSSLYDQMDKVIIETFLELQQAKKALISSKGNLDKINSLEEELAKCKADLRTAQGQLDNFRKTPSM